MLTTTNDYINSIKNLVQSIVDKANAESSKNTGGVVKPTTGGGGSSSAPAQQPASNQRNGRIDVGDVVTFTGRYYYDSYGSSRRTGTKYSGVPNGVVIDKVNSHSYGVHIRSADGKYPDLGWVNVSPR